MPSVAHHMNDVVYLLTDKARLLRSQTALRHLAQANAAFGMENPLYGFEQLTLAVQAMERVMNRNGESSAGLLRYAITHTSHAMKGVDYPLANDHIS